jgi:hypothetical protein
MRLCLTFLQNFRGVLNILFVLSFDEAWSVLQHDIAPFLEFCGDAVMFAKKNVVLDDEDDVTAMTIVVLMIKVAVVPMK